MKREFFLTEGQIQKCYKCQEGHCPVWNPFDEPYGESESVKAFVHDFVKKWTVRMNTEPIPCLTKSAEGAERGIKKDG